MARRQKGEKRAQARARLTAEAARVEVPAHADVCVVGGGAAGLAAAICSAEQGARTVVLERAPECGRTILATGNGRCNFANAHLEPSRYNDPPFVASVCGNRWLEDVLGFFADCGLAWQEEAEGRLYPLSRQAASVRSVLLGRARRAGVILAPLREVVSLSRTGNGLLVRYAESFAPTREASLEAHVVVVASGGGSILGAELGLATTPARPLLCPLACTGPALPELDGRRAHVLARLLRDGQEVAREAGEALFRTYGLSGIVVFDLSRHALPGDELVLDLLPGLPRDEACRLATHTLDGLLDPLVAQALAAHAGDAAQALELARALPCRVEGLAETGSAQVTRGGLATCQFDPATLEAHPVPGLFACGEALDVDGPCGGFNLAWAWKSGMVAGTAAAQPTRE